MSPVDRDSGDARQAATSVREVGDIAARPAGNTLPAAWVSEAMADLYAIRPGTTLHLPLRGTPRPFFVAGIWRDYARVSGAAMIDRADYVRLTGDADASDAALWLDRGVTRQLDQGSIVRRRYSRTQGGRRQRGLRPAPTG